MPDEATHPEQPHIHGSRILIAWLDERGVVSSYGVGLTNHQCAEICRMLAADFEKWAEADLNKVNEHKS